MSQPTRADILGGMLLLLRLAEQIPEIGIDHELRFCITGDDANAVAKLDQLAGALTTHNIPFVDESNDHDRSISFTAGAVRYEAFHVWRSAMAKHYARTSYEPNIEVSEVSA